MYKILMCIKTPYFKRVLAIKKYLEFELKN